MTECRAVSGCRAGTLPTGKEPMSRRWSQNNATVRGLVLSSSR
jgi:hypothetical protein